MRRYLLEQFRKNEYAVEETALKPDDLLNADEIFLTNVVAGIKWVKQFEDNEYPNQFSESLYRKFMDIFL
jgi:branched-chain amino acid aminotransferase